jgi:hypothetical protein
MGKRSEYVRRERDAYFTPLPAVGPMVRNLPTVPFTYCEPCAGDGRLISHIDGLCGSIKPSKCVAAYDVEPGNSNVLKMDALDLEERHLNGAEYIITNPPWDRSILHPMIERFSDLRPTWLLFDADWMHTKQAAPFANRVRQVVSIGRVKWIEDSKSVGKDNACWYLFGKPCKRSHTRFSWRT